MIAPAVNQFTFARIVDNTDGMHETQEGLRRWLELRRGFIGGSEASAALGLSRYQSKIGLYFNKTAHVDIDNDNEKMWAGRMMEPVIAEMFADRTGKHVIKQPYFYSHPEYPWMGANIDFGVYAENAGLECKNTTNKVDFVDGKVPDEYFLQCQHYMAVTGASRWYLAYLMDGWKFDYVVIERDEELLVSLIEGERAFWHDHVLPRVAPEFDGSESATKTLGLMYPREIEGPHDAVELPGDVDAMWEEEAAISEQIASLDTRRNEIRNKISALIGEKAAGESLKYTFTYKTVNRRGYTVEPRSYRQLRGRIRKEAN